MQEQEEGENHPTNSWRGGSGDTELQSEGGVEEAGGREEISDRFTEPTQASLCEEKKTLEW